MTQVEAGAGTRVGEDADGHPLTSAEAVLAGLDEQQRAAASAVSGPVCILAGAGTGKTRTITHRIAYGVHTGVYVPEQVLAVTFTARAAGELRSRLSRLSGWAACRRAPSTPRRCASCATSRPRCSAGRCPRWWTTSCGWSATPPPGPGCPPTAPSLRDLASEIEWAKTTLATPDDYPARAAKAGRELPFEAAAVAPGLRELRVGQAARRRRSTSRTCCSSPPTRWRSTGDVAQQVRGQYRHFVVDEYQDVNPLQQRLLDAWLGGRAEVCVVGDPNQTIYSFTGADPDYLLGFADRYPDAEVVKLERDYRSTPQVVGLANQLIGQAPPRRGLPGLRLLGQRRRRPRAAVRSSTRTSRPRPPPSRRRCRRAGRRRHAGRRDRGAVPDQRAVGGLRGGARRRRRPLRAQGRGAVLRAARGARGGAAPARRGRRWVASRARSCPPCATCWPPPAGPSTGRRRAAPRGTAGSRWRRSSTSPSTWPPRTPRWTSAGFVAHLAQRADAQHAPTVQGVTLASMHAAKGLEWDAVFVVGLVDGVAADRPVAVAAGGGRGGAAAAVRRRHPRPRAADAVLVAGPQPRRQAARPRSRFLTGLAPESSADRAAGPPARRRSRRSCSRARPASCSSGCARGAARPPSRRRCRPTWCSPTRRCRRSPRRGRPASASSRRCPASAPASWSSTARTCWPPVAG